MKIKCDVCEKEEASVFCSADEAALCEACDRRVHHANKLATKHQRFSLLQPSCKDSPRCDICQVIDIIIIILPDSGSQSHQFDDDFFIKKKRFSPNFVWYGCCLILLNRTSVLCFSARKTEPCSAENATFQYTRQTYIHKITIGFSSRALKSPQLFLLRRRPPPTPMVTMSMTIVPALEPKTRSGLIILLEATKRKQHHQTTTATRRL